jgi:hypothetical protein
VIPVRSRLALVVALVVVWVLLATGPTDTYPWPLTALFLVLVFGMTANTVEVLQHGAPEMWRRWSSNACLDCGHVYPVTEFPGAEPDPECSCCKENH